jgi:hypothetical protein
MKKINELKQPQMSTEETIIFLENLSKKMKDDREKFKPMIESLKKDFETYKLTGKIWEPSINELDGKTQHEIIELFRKNRPNI